MTMSEKDVEVDLTGESRDLSESRDTQESRDTTKTDTIDVSEVQAAIERVDLDQEEEQDGSRDEKEDESRDIGESREEKSRDVEEIQPIKKEIIEDEPEDTAEDTTEQDHVIEEDHVTEKDVDHVIETDHVTEIGSGSKSDPIELSEEEEQEEGLALETKEVLEMTEDNELDESVVSQAVDKELEETGEPLTESESSFGEFASEDEFGDFDDFEEMEETRAVEQPVTLDTSREETPMGSQTNLSSVTTKSVLSDDSFTSFTSLSFAAKSVLEDNGLVQDFSSSKESPVGQKFELSESASQIYALLCSVPNSELNFLKSFTRRLLLKDVGVPLDLDELLPRKEKQHFVIRRSRRSLDKQKSRDSSDKARTATATPTDSSRAQTPVTVDTELKLDSWLRLVEIRPEQRERMEQEELKELVSQLKTANIEAKLLLQQWEEKLALGLKNKEAFEAVVENMVGFAQKQRLKKGGKKK